MVPFVMGRQGLVTLVLMLWCWMSCSDRINVCSGLRFEWEGARDGNFTYEGDASVYGPQEVKLTMGVADAFLHPGAGRMLYSHPIGLCRRRSSSSSSQAVSSFRTSFTFQMNLGESDRPDYRGDGIAFFILSSPVSPPTPDPLLVLTKGLFGGLYRPVNDSSGSSSAYKTSLAVEFDTSQESWDPDDNHVGLNTRGSAPSAHVEPLSHSGIVLNSGLYVTAWIRYNAASQVLRVYAVNYTGPYPPQAPSLPAHARPLLSAPSLRLCDYLSADGKAFVGVSSASRGSVETHNLFSWSWRSSF